MRPTDMCCPANYYCAASESLNSGGVFLLDTILSGHRVSLSVIKSMLTIINGAGCTNGSIYAVVMLGGVTSVQLLFAGAKPEQHVDTQFVSAAEDTSGTLPALPPIPRGKSTVIGGAITRC